MLIIQDLKLKRRITKYIIDILEYHFILKNYLREIIIYEFI